MFQLPSHFSSVKFVSDSSSRRGKSVNQGLWGLFSYLHVPGVPNLFLFEHVPQFEHVLVVVGVGLI